MDAFIHVYIHAYIHAYMHTYTHTCMHTYIQIADYSAGTRLLQAITIGDTFICVSSAATLYGARVAGGTAPYVTGDLNDVVLWVKIGDDNTNPAGIMRVYVCMCVYVCMYVCMHVCMHVYTHTYQPPHT